MTQEFGDGSAGPCPHQRIAFATPVASAEHVRRTLNRHGIRFVGLADALLEQQLAGPYLLDFCATNPDVMVRYQADELDGIAAELNHLAVDAVFYGYEHDLAMADELALRLAPRFANDPATAGRREDKSVTDLCLREAKLPVPADVRFSLRGGLTRAELDQLDPTVDQVVIKSTRYKQELVLAAKEDLGATLARLRHERGPSDEPLLCQDAYFDLDADGLQQSYSLDGFALEGQYHFVSLQRWYKIITAKGIDYCWTEQLDVRAPAFSHVVDYTRTVLDLLGMHNGFFHPEITESNRGLMLLDLNPRVAGGSGIVDQMITSRQGAGEVDEFVEVMYGGPAPGAPVTPPEVRLLALYAMSPEDLRRVSVLESVAGVVFDPFVPAHFVRFENPDVHRMLIDVRHCIESFTEPRYGIRVERASRAGSDVD